MVSFPSVVEGMSYSDYSQVAALNWSSLKNIADCPAKFRVERLNPKPRTDAMKFGSAYHTYVLERSLFRSQYKVVPKMVRRGKDYEAACQEAAVAGKELLWEEELEQIEAMARVFDSHAFVPGLMKDSLREVSIFWKRAGIKCKARIDIANPTLRILGDLKTTQCSRPEKFINQLATMGYDQQMAWYLDGLANNRIYMEACVIFGQSKDRPFGVWGYELKRDELVVSAREVDKLFSLYETCNESNHWPLYPEVLTQVEIPKFIREKRNKGELLYGESD